MGMILNKGKNLIINGALDYWQRGTSFAAIANAVYFADRFQYAKSGTMVHTVAQSTDVPSLALAGTTLPYSMRFTLTTPQTSFVAGQFSEFYHKVEGYNLAPVAGKKQTLMFFVKSPVTGVLPVAFRNADGSRSFVKTITIAAANVWAKYVITVPHDPTGTWNYTNGVGLIMSINFGGDVAFRAPAEDTWYSVNYNTVATATNFLNTGMGDIYFAGFMLSEGEQSSNFERAGYDAFRELMLCQRYFEKSYEPNVAPGTANASGAEASMDRPATTEANNKACFKVTKRATPAITVYAASTGSIGKISQVDGTTPGDKTVVTAAASMFGLRINSTIGSVGAYAAAQWTADAEL